MNADEGRLGQVFIDLLVNAVQALPEGGSDQNEIRIVTSTDARGRAVVEISDTGVGISAAAMPRIFDPFFTTKAVGVGTGLGLSMCHTIVKGLGGEISASSVQGAGTPIRHFDLIISDLMMPVMSGMDVYDVLERRFPEAPRRVVFMSGGQFTEPAKQFLDRVKNERMEKPFDAKSVRALVQRRIGASRECPTSGTEGDPEVLRGDAALRADRVIA